MKLLFTWIEAHQAIADKLFNYRENQQGLIDILSSADVKLEDEAVRGIKGPLTEIDPLTFFSYIYKHGTLKNKRVLRTVCRLMDIDVDVKDVCGVPSPDARNVWYFPYKWERVHNEIGRLWSFFEKLMSGNLADDDFKDILSIKGVGKAKLLDGMFRIRPFDYLCLNGVVNPYLIKYGIDPDFSTLTQLRELQVRIQNELNTDFPKLSYDAYLDIYYKDHKPAYFRIGSTAGTNGPSVLPEMLENKVVSIGWHELGDIENINPLSKAGIQNALIEEEFYEDKRTASRKAGEILTFYEGIAPKDYVLVADGMAIKAIGRVISENYFYEDRFRFPHCRNVEWIKTDIDDLFINEGLMTSVWQYGYPESIQLIESYLNIGAAGPIAPDTQETPSAQLPYFPLNVILYGPPGTGKTFETIDLAVEIIKGTKSHHSQSKQTFDELRKDKRIAFVTFHQNYTYEDFMVGIKPRTDAGSLSFRPHTGIFYDIVKRAQAAYENAKDKMNANRYVLIIDEINRANISRVFGELITLLEDDKRLGGDNELVLTLPNGEEFGVPPNLFIVGTMNTADKSIALIDIALRRRFEFRGMYPKSAVLQPKFSDRIPFLEAINKKIYEKRRSADYLIGHAYLLKEDSLEDIIERKIIPLLMEYFSGRVDDVASVFEGSGYHVKYDEAAYKWKVDLNSVSNEVSEGV